MDCEAELARVKQACLATYSVILYTSGIRMARDINDQPYLDNANQKIYELSNSFFNELYPEDPSWTDINVHCNYFVHEDLDIDAGGRPIKKDQDSINTVAFDEYPSTWGVAPTLA